MPMPVMLQALPGMQSMMTMMMKKKMKEKGVALIPTLKLWHSELRHDRLSAQQSFIDNGVAQLRAWLGVGGTVLFGTDVGYMDDYTTAQEYELMAKAGMTHRQHGGELAALGVHAVIDRHADGDKGFGAKHGAGGEAHGGFR